VTGVTLQWQNAKQITLWPKAGTGAKIEFPPFVHLTASKS
jgi:hypothetical protein